MEEETQWLALDGRELMDVLMNGGGVMSMLEGIEELVSLWWDKNCDKEDRQDGVRLVEEGGGHPEATPQVTAGGGA